MLKFIMYNYLYIYGDDKTMTDISRLCMVCLSETDENGHCCECQGNNTEIVQTSPLLPLKTILNQRYVIAKMQKKNSEGITYSAYDIKTQKKVSVREFFPENLSSRAPDEITVESKKATGNVYSQYMSKFLALWNKLMRLKGLSALISVTDVFEANATCYAVYDESERITLRDYLLSTKEGFIPWEKARLLFMPVLSTLGTLHTSGLLHRGLNPTSFIFSSAGKLKITDFCIEPVRSPSGAIDSEFFEGYTPIEQYTGLENTGAWTDIYSFCCVLYRALVGTTPIDAKARVINDQMMIPAKFAEQLPPYVINGLINGMEIKPVDRTDNVEQLRCDLSASPRAMGASANAYEEMIERLPQKKTAPQTAKETVPTQKTEPSPPSPQSPKTRTAPQEPASSATKKINPFIMPLSPDNENEGDRKGQTQPIKKTPSTEKAEPTPQKETQKAQKEAVTDSDEKKKKTLIIILSSALVLIVITIVLLGSYVAGRPIVGGVRVPALVGEHISIVTDNPDLEEYFLIEISQQHNIEYPADHIISQSLDSDIRVPKGTKLKLVVSLGAKQMEIPDLKDKTPAEANRILTEMGFVCKEEKYPTTDSEKYGKIYDIVSSSATYSEQGDTIIIVVYSPYSTEEEIPSESSSADNSVSEFLEGLEMY